MLRFAAQQTFVNCTVSQKTAVASESGACPFRLAYLWDSQREELACKDCNAS